MGEDRGLSVSEWVLLLVAAAFFGVFDGGLAFGFAMGVGGPWLVPLLGFPLLAFLIRSIPLGARWALYATAVASGFVMTYYAASGYSS